MLAKSKRQLRGLTLIELMVTVVILVMLLVGVAPSIGAWMRNTQVRNVASSMLAGLNRARNEAMRRNVPVRFSLVSLADSTVLGSSLCAVGRGRVVGRQCAQPDRQLPGRAGHDHRCRRPRRGDRRREQSADRRCQCRRRGRPERRRRGQVADGSAAADTVTFGSFGRITDAAPIGFINISNASAGNDYRRLRIELGTGGTVRLCDLGVTVQTDPRYCPTWTIP